MKSKAAADQLTLYKAIDNILWNDWDPINLNDNENLRDEYQRYTSSIYKLKIEGATVEVIASRLREIEIKIGLDNEYIKCIEIAQKIVALNS